MKAVASFSADSADWELLRRVASLDQAAGTEPLVLDDGPARGVPGLRVRTGSGLSFTVLPDWGLDLAAEHRSGF